MIDDKSYKYPVTASIEMDDNDFDNLYDDLWAKLDNLVGETNEVYTKLDVDDMEEVLAKIMADFLEFAKHRLTDI